MLSNFEANRFSNENSRVGPPDLTRQLKSGTGTPDRVFVVFCLGNSSTELSGKKRSGVLRNKTDKTQKVEIAKTWVCDFPDN